MKRLIHLDNSAFFRKVFKNFLVNEGITAESLNTGVSAFEFIKDGDIGLVITGTMLADMDGYQFIKLCNIMAPEIPIIVLSANSPEDEEEKLAGMRVEAIVAKGSGWQKGIRPFLDKYIGDK